MAQGNNAKIVKDGLVFHYDMYNKKSWKGQPTTNILNLQNAYPTASNNWGTYNTNQYNSNTYFSIGTISGVANNIVTLGTVGRTINTYDCLRPQTTGGGVTAGVDYLVRKISSTEFSLHAYSAAQSGATGWQVHDSVNDDSKIAINATSFPTMWLGVAHRPNSGLVKEIVSKGFTHNGRTHDCIRLNVSHRGGGGGLDGLAYGYNPTATAGVTYTISWYQRCVHEEDVGVVGPGLSLYSAGAYFSMSEQPGSNRVLSREWTRVIYHGTCVNTGGTNFYIFPSRDIEIAEFMMEDSLIASEFLIGTRSNTEALLDLTGNNTITVDSLTYNNDNTFKFNGSNSYLDLGADVEISPDNQGWTAEYWFKTDNAGSHQNFSSADNDEFNANWLSIYNSKLAVWNRNPGYWRYGDTILQSNTWYQAVFIFDAGGTNMRFYINGKREGGDHVNNVWSPEYSSLVYRYVGTYHYIGSKSRWFDGEISKVKVYNRALTDQEIKQNFNALRGRFGI